MKKLKIFSVIALVVIIAAGSYLLYMFKFKEYDVADEEVKEIIEKEPYKVELPDGSTIYMDENGEIIEETSGNSETAGTDSSGGSGSTQTNTGNSNSSNTNSSSKDTGKTAGSSTSKTPSANNGSSKPDANLQSQSVSEIMAKYQPAMEGLEGQADVKINALVGRAKTEYSSKKANGESIDYGYFYNKYMSAAKDLEGNTDKVFNAVLKAVEKDLAANGHDQSEAQSMKKEYEAKKKARRDGILSQAMGSK